MDIFSVIIAAVVIIATVAADSSKKKKAAEKKAQQAKQAPASVRTPGKYDESPKQAGMSLEDFRRRFEEEVKKAAGASAEPKAHDEPASSKQAPVPAPAPAPSSAKDPDLRRGRQAARRPSAKQVAAKQVTAKPQQAPAAEALCPPQAQPREAFLKCPNTHSAPAAAILPEGLSSWQQAFAWSEIFAEPKAKQQLRR